MRRELDPRARECPEGLARGATQLEVDRAAEVTALEGASERGPERSIGRGHAQAGGRHGSLAAERGGDARLQDRRLAVADAVAGGRGIGPARGRGAPRRGADDRRKLGTGLAEWCQESAALADDLADGASPDGRQLAPEVLRESDREAFDVLGCAGELGPQVLALGGDAGRAGVEVALAGHVAAERDERGGPERELLGAEQRRDEQVAPGLEAAVRPQDHAVAEVVAHQDLVDLGQPELPWRAHVLDRGQRRRAGAAGVPRQVDVRGAGLGHARGDRPDPAPGHELDPDPRGRVDGAQVGDELGEVLDRVDVVVRRRADVALAGLAAAERGDVARSPCARAAGRPRRASSPGRS